MKILLLCAVVLFAGRSEQVDQTMVEQASGLHVVEAVISRIQEKCVFDDDKLFLRRLAFVESQDGTDSGTFTASYFGGIWKVDESKFTLTKSVSASILNAVQSEYGIDWTAVTWNDLLKPLYSGLAARLYLQYKDQTNFEIPSSLADQASYWVTHYRPSASSAQFITTSKQINKVCSPVADVAFMIDGSESVTEINFEKVKEFVKKVTSELNVGPDSVLNSRVSVSVFSDVIEYSFDFSQYSTVSAYQNGIDSIPYPFGGTNTHLALNHLTSNTFLPSKGARDSSVPKIAIVVTDGKSKVKDATLISAANLLASGVRVFAIGVGSFLDFQELEAIASDPDCNHLSLLKDFNEFDALVNQIERKVCDVETAINPNGTEIDIDQDDIKLYTYTFNVACNVLAIRAIVGEAKVYYSSSYQPNPAIYEGFVEVSPANPCILFSSLQTGVLYITVEAVSDVTLTFKFLKFSCSCPNGFVPSSLGTNLKRCIKGPATITTLAPISTGGYNCGTNNPCSPSVIVPDKFHYPHDNVNKFVQCSEWGQCYEMPCPPTLVWNDSIQNCDYSNGNGGVTNSGSSSSGGYDCGSNNPCSPSVIVADKFHYPHTNIHKFVQCSEWGQCYEMPCSVGLVWNDAIQTCDYSSGNGNNGVTRPPYSSSETYDCASNNPCSPDVLFADKFYYKHTDSNKFVQCSKCGQCYEVTCPASLLWIDAELKCDSNSGSSSVSYNCATNNPCSPSVIVPNKFHYPHDDANKFVQCSEWGQCYEMPCPPTLVWYDNDQACNYP